MARDTGKRRLRIKGAIVLASLVTGATLVAWLPWGQLLPLRTLVWWESCRSAVPSYLRTPMLAELLTRRRFDTADADDLLCITAEHLRQGIRAESTETLLNFVSTARWSSRQRIVICDSRPEPMMACIPEERMPSVVTLASPKAAKTLIDAMPPFLMGGGATQARRNHAILAMLSYADFDNTVRAVGIVAAHTHDVHYGDVLRCIGSQNPERLLIVLQEMRSIPTHEVRRMYEDAVSLRRAKDNR